MPRVSHLTPEECRHLEAYEHKQRIIRDLVCSVAGHYLPALYLSGRAGIGKTYIVKDELKKCRKEPVYRNARVTAPGLFELFDKHADRTFVFDDVTNFLRDKAALQYLQGALDTDEPRIITRTVYGRDQIVVVTGGVIAISNVSLKDDAIAKSIQSRVVQHEFDATNAEIAAFMKHLVLEGRADTKGLSRSDSLKVVQFLIEETRNHALELDLRHLKKAAAFFRQWKDGQARNDWRELVRVDLRKPIRTAPASKQDELAEQRNFVETLLKKYPNDRERQIQEFEERFEKGNSTFYKRKSELENRRRDKRVVALDSSGNGRL